VHTRLSTRDRILDAAAKVMGECGLAHATTRQIARAAGLSEASLYKHFADKTELFVRVLAERMPFFGPLLADLAATPEQGTLAENLRQVATAAHAFYDRTFPMAASLFAEPAMLAGHRAGLRRDGTGPQHPTDWLADYLRAEQRLGRVRPELDVRAAATLLLGGCLNLAFLGHFADPRPDQASTCAALAALVDTLLPALAAG
jgi:AcrR family transcriptional regulator